ncbi:MAG: hypothetical protein RLZZ15_2848, partial [Verrucomicrobiota bacterium]
MFPLNRQAGRLPSLLLTLTLSLFFGTSTLRLNAAAELSRRSFALAAADAEVTLEKFSDQAGAQVVYLIEDVRGVTTNPVQGTFAIREALDRLVARTALRVDLDGKSGAFVIRRDRQTRPATEQIANPNTASNPPMKKSLAARIFAVLTAPAVFAQAPAAKPADEVVKLNVFEVSAAAPNRYQAAEVTSGGRIRTAIFDSPQTINVVTEALLKDVGAVRILDALKYVPGVTESTLPNGLDRVTVRGFQIDGATVDGFYDITQANIDPLTLDRLEVVKGPNAILAPTGSPGGTINNVTKKPLFVAPRHSMRLDYGAFDAGSIEFDSTGRLGDAKSPFAYRLLVAYRDFDNYYGNTATKRHTIAPSLTYQFNPKTKVVLQAEFSRWRAGAYLGIPIDPSSGSTNTATLLAGVPARRSVYADDIYRVDNRSAYRAVFTSDLNDNLSVRVAARQAYYYMDNQGLNFANAIPGGARDPRTGLYTPGLIYGPGPTFTASPAPAQTRFFTRGGQRSTVTDKKQNFQNDWVYNVKISEVSSVTSAGFAYTRRLPDGPEGVLNENLTNTPLNFDGVILSPLTHTGVINTRDANYELTRQFYANESLTFLDGRVIVSGGVSKLDVSNS